MDKTKFPTVLFLVCLTTEVCMYIPWIYLQSSIYVHFNAIFFHKKNDYNLYMFEQ